MTENFIRNDLEGLRTDDPADQSVLRAINETDMEEAERMQRLLKWLNYYRVLLFFPPENSKQVAHQILAYADNERSVSKTLARGDIFLQYKMLREKLCAAAHRNPISGKPRNVDSLTSKALWCCYPSDIPIMDDYAERALQVISRLSGIKLKTGNLNKDRYECFLEVWFLLYERVAPVIDPLDPTQYPFKPRVLDRLLWHYGQPNYDSA